MSEVKTRLTFAKTVVQEAGMSALKEFAHWKDLAITEKGAQDFVS
ncbi:MAG TPA: inositol monophosphatase, partial [Gammaproteobacteria bacterium]|nr:inositol monophosphatase [Gammaproteobacteria bacterium]